MSLLQVRGLVKRFGGVTAVDGLDLEADAGAIVGLIGPNGAGKTTTFNCLSGHDHPNEGVVSFDGEDVSRLDVHQRARRGMGRTFQRLEVFSRMSVRDNLRVAAEAAHGHQPGWRDLLRLRPPQDDEVEEEVERSLEAVGLAGVGDEVAGELSTGLLRLLEVGRALCGRPRLLLLDEPASGLDEQETARLEALLRDLREQGMGVLVVEHDIDLVLRICDRIFVLDFGRLIADGPPEVIAEHPAVQAAYLGVGA
jgi:branched-chain amino acid transport system ATP-binding protein